MLAHTLGALQAEGVVQRLAQQFFLGMAVRHRQPTARPIMVDRAAFDNSQDRITGGFGITE
ncbi:MAG TPA: hypothetical protein PLG92_10185, partial [Piscinibacter sp.]|nr:hypothetical protein [Piscinibacter sp.]